MAKQTHYKPPIATNQTAWSTKYQYVATAGRGAGQVRSGQVVVGAETMEEGRAIAIAKIADYGHANPKIGPTSAW